MRIVITRFLLLCGLFLSVAGWASAQSDQLGAVRAAFANGSSRDLAQFLAPSVEVGFDGDQQAYNATQTELVVKNFFAKNPPSSFDVVHQGASTDGIPYVVWRYVGRSGNYQVFMRLKSKQGPPTIDKLDFTKQ